MTSFSAALLAGGRLTRMGRDKAMLELPGSNLPLWQRQLRVLEDLQPAEIFWSGHARFGTPDHVRIVPDCVENAGPLAGISACLEICESELLLVLAIDLPRMTAACLNSLLARCSPGRGAVFRHDDFFEPLAAIYPKRLQSLATDHLREGCYALQNFIREALRHDALQVFPITEANMPLFKNLNSPGDLQDI